MNIAAKLIAVSALAIAFAAPAVAAEIEFESMTLAERNVLTSQIQMPQAQTATDAYAWSGPMSANEVLDSRYPKDMAKGLN